MDASLILCGVSAIVFLRDSLINSVTLTYLRVIVSMFVDLSIIEYLDTIRVSSQDVQIQLPGRCETLNRRRSYR